jgi:hypothetical protein
MKLHETVQRLSEGRVEYVAAQFGPRLISAAQSDNKIHSDDPLEIARQLLSIDPTGQQGKYLTFLARAYANKQFRMEDAARMQDTMKQFEKMKSRLPADQRDINKYTSLDQVYDVVEKDSPTVSKKQQIKSTKKEGIKQLVKTENIFIGELLSHAAACYYGAGTKWCTAGRDSESTFSTYANQGPIFIIVLNLPEGKQRKFQFHYASSQVMNEKDVEINKKEIELLSSYPEWGKFIQWLISSNYATANVDKLL